MSQMHNHPHPSYTLRDDVLPAPGISQTDAAAPNDIQNTTATVSGTRLVGA